MQWEGSELMPQEEVSKTSIARAEPNARTRRTIDPYAPGAHVLLPVGCDHFCWIDLYGRTRCYTREAIPVRHLGTGQITPARQATFLVAVGLG